MFKRRTTNRLVSRPGSVLILAFVAAILVIPQRSRIQIGLWQLTGIVTQVTCKQLVRDSQVFDQSLIKIKARIASDASGIYVYNCGNRAGIAWMSLLFDDSSGLTPETKQWLMNLQHLDNQTQVKTSEAVLTGRFTNHHSSGSLALPYNLRVTRIEQPSEVVLGVPQHP